MPLLTVADSGFVHFHLKNCLSVLSLNLVFLRGEADSDVLLSISSRERAWCSLIRGLWHVAAITGREPFFAERTFTDGAAIGAGRSDTR